MLARVRTCPASRLAASLLLVSLTGAPRIAVALAGGTEHRCTCAARGGERRCECPTCRARATHAHDAARAVAKRPPCHGPAAAAPAREEPPRPAPAGAPCLSGACGEPDGPRALVSGLEPFTLAPDGAPAALAPAGSFASLDARVLRVPRAPEPPPPRA